MKSKIMKRAHELARMMEGDYAARLAIALRLAWKEVRKMDQQVKITLKEWFLRKERPIHNPKKIAGLVGVILKETEKAYLVKGIIHFKDTYRGKESEASLKSLPERWIPKSAVEAIEVI